MSVPSLPLDPQVVQALSVVSTATLTTVLLKHVQPGDLLVVGARGHGRGVGSLLMGSVSEKCVRQAPCSVVVVRPAI